MELDLNQDTIKSMMEIMVRLILEAIQYVKL